MHDLRTILKPLLAALAATVFGLSAGLGLAADAIKQEIHIATQHAQYAAKMSALDQTHMHLQHVVNCLVGPNGADFYANALNPCKGKGNGAINDAQAGSDRQMLLKDALDVAKIGLANDRPAPAIGSARAVHVLLEEAARAQ